MIEQSGYKELQRVVHNELSLLGQHRVKCDGRVHTINLSCILDLVRISEPTSASFREPSSSKASSTPKSAASASAA